MNLVSFLSAADNPQHILFTESVYDLLPTELQLPFSKQQSEAAMSQTSGGDAGPAPAPAALGPGELPFLLSSLEPPGTVFHSPTCWCGPRRCGLERGYVLCLFAHSWKNNKRI